MFTLLWLILWILDLISKCQPWLLIPFYLIRTFFCILLYHNYGFSSILFLLNFHTHWWFFLTFALRLPGTNLFICKKKLSLYQCDHKSESGNGDNSFKMFAKKPLKSVNRCWPATYWQLLLISDVWSSYCESYFWSDLFLNLNDSFPDFWSL